jgi:hypothetical protein
MAAPKSYTQFAIFHDSETTYASGGNPAQASKALMAFDAPPPQLNAERKARPFVAPYFGSRPFLLANKHWAFGFMLEAQGSGTAGTAPPMGRMFPDAGMTETLKTSTAVIDATAKAVGTVSGAFTYTRTTAGTAKTMRKVTLTCTTGGGTGVAAFTVSAPASGKGASAENAYNQAGVIMTNATPFNLASGAVITPTITTPFQVGDTFTIEIGPPRAEYAPTSDRDNHDSGAMNWHLDDHKFAIIGARCGLTYDAMVVDYPRFGFQYMGLYAAPTKVAQPNVDYSAFREPEIVDNDNTQLIEIHGFQCVLKSFQLNLGNQLTFKNRVGRKEVCISGREVTATAVIEAPDLAAKNYFQAVDNHTQGNLRFIHGTTPGKIHEVRGEAVQLAPLRIDNDQNDVMFNVEMVFNPVDLSVGDDEVKCLFM